MGHQGAEQQEAVTPCNIDPRPGDTDVILDTTHLPGIRDIRPRLRELVGQQVSVPLRVEGVDDHLDQRLGQRVLELRDRSADRDVSHLALRDEQLVVRRRALADHVLREVREVRARADDLRGVGLERAGRRRGRVPQRLQGVVDGVVVHVRADCVVDVAALPPRRVDARGGGHARENRDDALHAGALAGAGVRGRRGDAGARGRALDGVLHAAAGRPQVPGRRHLDVDVVLHRAGDRADRDIRDLACADSAQRQRGAGRRGAEVVHRGDLDVGCGRGQGRLVALGVADGDGGLGGRGQGHGGSRDHLVFL